MNSRRSALDRLADQNPVEVSPRRVEPDTDADTDTDTGDDALIRILSSPREVDDIRPRHRPLVLVAAAAAVGLVVAAAVGITIGTGNNNDGITSAQPAFVLPETTTTSFELAPLDGTAGTPSPLMFVAFDRPVDAAELLDSLAETAGAQPPAPGNGRYEYSSTREWSFFTRQSQDGEVFDQGIAESERQDWRGPDGSGRTDTIENGAREVTDVPAQPPRSRLEAGPGESVDSVRQRLLDAGRSWSPAQWLDTYAQEWSAQIIPPIAQKAYLQALADSDGVDVVGEVTDRAGRTGVAVSASSADVRTVLIFDINSGALLDFERIALSDNAVEVPVPLPSTVGYTVFLERGFVQSVGELP